MSEKDFDSTMKNYTKLKQEKERLEKILDEFDYDLVVELTILKEKIEKIKEYCNKTFNDGVWNGYEMNEKDRQNILQIIEGGTNGRYNNSTDQ